MRRIVQLLPVLASLALFPADVARPASLVQVGTFDRPIFVTSDPDDRDRLFVVQREGLILAADGESVEVLADLTGLVSCCQSERGLFSMALAPDFSTSGRFYAAYSGTVSAGGEDGDLHVDAFRRGGVEGELVREPIITIGHTDYDNHYSGQIHFGPDGYLYVSVGDGGGGGDPLESGQRLETLLGKILRIDPRPGEEPPYAIPPDNPFLATPGEDEIWSYGLRNPWRFSFDRATGDMVIGDVGQNAREEIDHAPSPSPGMVGGGGANYGWNCREGLVAYTGAPAACAGPFIDPVFDYPHSNPGDGSAFGCAVTGGYVVRDPTLGDLYGRYAYADFCTGEVRSLKLPSSPGEPAKGDRSEGLGVGYAVSFGEDSSGRVYIASIEGDLFRLAPGDASPGGGSPVDRLPPAASAGPAPRRTRLLVRLARRRRAGIRRYEAVVRVRPCPPNRGRRVRLNRGGKRFAAKRLNRRCNARFRLPRAAGSTFRALLLEGGRHLRSRRLRVRPLRRARSHRSHVRKIALAKPSP